MSLFNTRQNTGNSGSQKSGTGPIEQLLFALAIVVVVYLAFMFMEVIYKYVNRMSMNRKELLPYTYQMDNRTIIIPQDPNVKGSKTISVSENERTGTEFSYSFYLQAHPAAFTAGNAGLLHIFHKGYTSQFPLLAPGVYMLAHINTLRIYMNTYKTWNNYIDIPNIPVSKWVHVAILCKENALHVFINGNLSKKKSFEGYPPYQNYQDICCFSQRKIALLSTKIPSLEGTDFKTFGAMKGMLSRLIYFNYALCYAEIQQLMNEGPSSRMDNDTNNNVPPYMADTWWANGY